MSSSYYPPGHPSGTMRSEEEVTCKCGTTWTYTIITEADTNASYPANDGDDCCPECGREYEP